MRFSSGTSFGSFLGGDTNSNHLAQLQKKQPQNAHSNMAAEQRMLMKNEVVIKNSPTTHSTDQN